MNEPVVDFIGRSFKKVLGMGKCQRRLEILYLQLQESLLLSLQESPAVSDAQTYKEMCIAARREEWRLNELKKKQQYLMKIDQPDISYKPKKQILGSRYWF